jgi:hypothetical protein
VFPNRSIYMKSAVGITGDLMSAAKTPNIALSIEKRSSRPGRRGVGRLQLAGVPENSYLAGEFDPSYMTDVKLDFDAQLTGLISVTATSAVYAPCLYGGLAVTSDDDVFAIQPKSSVRTMHRRTVRVGE